MTDLLTVPVDRPLAAVSGAELRVPLVQGGDARYVNLDYAASAPALAAVTDHLQAALPVYASVHRGAGYASQVSTAAYAAARADVAGFVGARPDDVVVFVRNTTDALNLLATAVPGPVVHLDVEHHANLLPWRATGGRVVAARPTLAATLAAVEAELAARPASLLAVTGASNVTGECLPLGELAAIAHRHGARIAVDGAQLVPHRRVALAELGIDYLAFSGHKLYAPFGAGVLVGRRDWLDAAPPYLAGGGAVRSVEPDRTVWADGPERHEGGTPNVLGAIALAAACRAVAALPEERVRAAEAALVDRLRAGLIALGARVLRIWPDAGEAIGLVTFVLPGFDPGLVATYLSAEHGIGVRAGRFCAHPLLVHMGADAGAVRASVGLGSRAADVERLLSALARLLDEGPGWAYESGAGGWAPTPETRAVPEWLAGVELGSGARPCGL